MSSPSTPSPRQRPFPRKGSRVQRQGQKATHSHNLLDADVFSSLIRSFCFGTSLAAWHFRKSVCSDAKVWVIASTRELSCKGDETVEVDSTHASKTLGEEMAHTCRAAAAVQFREGFGEAGKS